MKSKITLFLVIFSAVTLSCAQLSRADTMDAKAKDDLDYGIRSGLLPAAVASAVCICQFVEHVDYNECLERVHVKKQSDLLTSISVDDQKQEVRVTPSLFGWLLVFGGGPEAVARYNSARPEFGCTLVKSGGQTAP